MGAPNVWQSGAARDGGFKTLNFYYPALAV